MAWWHWLVIGLVLIALELSSSGGFYIIFFGVAALIVAGLSFFAAAGPVGLQWLLFSALSIISLLLFREPLMKRLYVTDAQTDLDTLVGQAGTAIDDIAAGAVGQVEVRGATWNARNSAARTLARGERCLVVSRHELTLFVQPEEAM
jgi:inner membrane protein